MSKVGEVVDPRDERTTEWRDAGDRVLRAYRAWCAATRSHRHELYVDFLHALRREERAAWQVGGASSAKTLPTPRASKHRPRKSGRRTKGSTMAQSTHETPLLDLLKDMTAASLDATNLDEQTLMLVRIAALVAVDAPPVSYAMNLEAASEVGVDADHVRGVLAAVAPIVGTTRIVSATSSIAGALALEIELELDKQSPQ